MLIDKRFGIAISLVVLALIGDAAAGRGQTGAAEKPSAETVAKLIAKLGSAELRTRQQASEELEKFGAPVLPALRKAATTAKVELEVKRRIEHVVSQIENGLLKAEEKRWQDLDAPRRSIKDRIVNVLARTPTLSDQQLTSAIYLLSVARAPTDAEVAQAKKQFAAVDGRLVNVLQLARALVQGKEFNAELAGANARLFKARKELATEVNLAQKLQRLNGPEFAKLAEELAVALDKKLKTDELVADTAFLLVLSRYPTATDTKSVVAHLKKRPNRSAAAADIFWALINTKEFLVAP